MDKNNPRVIFGRRLAKARKEVGLTQLAVALHFDIEKNTVSAWERGGGLPDALRLLHLARLYKLTPNDLLLAEDDMADRPSPRAMELAREFDACDDPGAKDMAESVATQLLRRNPKANPAPVKAPPAAQPTPERVRHR